MENLNEKEIQKLADNVFKSNPNCSHCFVSVDGQVFTDKNESFARSHASSKGVKLIKVEKAKTKTKTETTESPKKESKKGSKKK